MDIVFLPGNSSVERTWVDSLETKFAPEFENVYVQYYDHWFGGAEQALLDWDNELQKLGSYVEEMGEHLIFAHAEGVLLALKGIAQGVLMPEVCVFVDTPLKWGIAQGLAVEEWFLNNDTPTLYIQRTEGAELSEIDLKNYLHDMNVTGYEVRSLPECSDKAEEQEMLLELTKQFVDFS